MCYIHVKGGDRITDNQKKFAEIYLETRNATEAYSEVYGTKDRDAAGRRACTLLKKKEIKDYVERERKFREIGKRKIIELLSAVAFTSPAALAEIVEEGGKQKIRWKSFDELDDEVKAAIAVVKNTPSGISVETLDRLKATDLLMKYLDTDANEADGVIIEGEGDIEE